MDYYLITPNDQHFLVGIVSLGVFYKEVGFDMLVSMMNKKPDFVTEITIKDEFGKTYEIDEFLTLLEQLKVRWNA